MNLSAIVRLCRLGKNRVHEYLRDLEVRGLLKIKEDGYRVWYKVDAQIKKMISKPGYELLHLLVTG